MRVVPLVPQQHTVLSDALVQKGWDPGRADAAARGLTPVSFFIEGMADDARELVIDASRSVGLECLTGDGWALVVGGVSRVASMSRPGFTRLPNEIAEPLGTQLRGFVERPTFWTTARGTVALEKPIVAGILNVTPDSFSDGGRFLDPESAIRHAEALVAAGANLIDIGAESTRPGRPDPVTADAEWDRLAPVIRAVVSQFPEMPISVDTVKAEVARRALAEGAWIINDVSGFRIDPDMPAVCAAGRAGVILMHSRGGVTDMATYDHAVYNDVMHDVSDELGAQVQVAMSGGVSAESIVVDPGLGFSKRPNQNYMVLRRLKSLESLGRPIMVGPSRKRFLRESVGDGTEMADDATAAACVSAYFNGAQLFRVHDVEKTVAVLAVAQSIGG